MAESIPAVDSDQLGRRFWHFPCRLPYPLGYPRTWVSLVLVSRELQGRERVFFISWKALEDEEDVQIPVHIGKTMRGRKLWRRENGSALVEFALILPILVLLLFGVIEFGLLLYNQQVITNASREGARYGIVSRVPDRRSVDEITQVVNDYCASNMITFGSSTGPDTNVGPHSLTALFGDDLTVEVTYLYDFLVLPGFIGSFAGGTELSAKTTMKYE